MTTEAVGADRLREMLAGCEGVTPGPWVAASNHSVHRVGDMYAEDGYVEALDGYCIEAPAYDDHVTGRAAIGDPEVAAHIANCDPQTIASIITELLALRSATPAPLPAGGDEVEAVGPEFETLSIERLKAIRDNADNGMAARIMAGELLIARARLSPPLQGEAGGVRVKALEWSQSPVFGSMKRRGFGIFGEFTAFTVDGLTPEQIAAKEAAAQADYEQRIRSAREPTPAVSVPDGAEGVPVVWRWRYPESMAFHGRDWKFQEIEPDWLKGRGYEVQPLYASPPPPALGEGSGWQDIASAPKDGTRVLVTWRIPAYDDWPWAIQVARRSRVSGLWLQTLDSKPLPEEPVLWRSISPPPSALGEGGGWQDISTAPKDKPVIVAIRSAPDKEWVLGEAAWYVSDDAAEEGWWWAGSSPGDEYDRPMREYFRHDPQLWHPMPPAPHPEGQQNG